MTRATTVPARNNGRARHLLVAIVAVGAASAAWVAAHRTSTVAQAVEAPASVPKRDLSVASAPSSSRVGAPAVAAAASHAVAVASALPAPQVEAAAESLRKVQLALSGGSAQDDLMAAIALESCAHADKTANDLVQGRDAVNWLPPEVKKVIDQLPRISDVAIDRAQREQRRCQVFDAATLGRRGELYREAYEGGAQGAALPYLRWLKTEGDKEQAAPDLIARLQSGARADAEAADLPVLASFAFGGQSAARETGADAVQMNAYREAYFRIVEEGAPGQSTSGRDLVSKLSLLGPAEPVMTAQQQRQAEVLTRQIMQAWHRRRFP